MNVLTYNGWITASKKIRYNTIVKNYLCGAKQWIVCNKPIFCPPGQASSESRLVSSCKLGRTDEILEENVSEWVEMSVWEMEEYDRCQEERRRENMLRAMRRARTKIRDYALCTPMTWFATLTLDQVKVNRYDVDAMTKHLNVWLNNHVKRDGLAYIMVPELHQDGAIHYHALMTDAIEAVDSGTIIPGFKDWDGEGKPRPRRPRSEGQRREWLKHGGRVVYNLPQWPYGFTTAVRLEGYYERAVNYVSKYISKGHNLDRKPCKVGGRWFYHGGDLGEPVKDYMDMDIDEARSVFGGAVCDIRLPSSLEGLEMVTIWQEPDGTLRDWL